MKTNKIESIRVSMTVNKISGKNVSVVEFERLNGQTHVWTWKPYYPNTSSLIRLIKVINQ